MVSGNCLNVSSAPAKDYADDDIQKVRSANDWLPVTSSRNGKWWYSAFHNVTAMVGAGVLSLPYTMVFLGWGPGICLLVLSWMITLYTLWQLVDMHESVPGRRFDRYHELAQYTLGETRGLWILVPLNLTVEVGVDIVYMVTGGQSLKKFHETVCHSCGKIRQSYWILIFSSVHFFLAQLPNLNSVAGVSLAAAVMSLSYSTIAWGACFYHGQLEDVSYGYVHTTPANTVFRVLNSLGVIAFAFAGHNVALEIQATIPSTPEKPSKIPMWRGVLVAYFVTALCYFPVAIVGYWAFGQIVDDNVLLTLKKPDWLIAAANMMVVVHVIGSYQVFAMPVYDMIETVLVKNFSLAPGFWLRLLSRSSYVAFTCFIAVTFPFFGDLLGFFGGLAFAPTTYFLPCIMWLIINKPKRFSLPWLVNWFCIIFGVVLMLISTVGGLRSIIIDAYTYDFYQ
ncbi:lysine histidine transporter 2 [Cryptomeria japonica]|uniref:lysine histidine transporter 2 n=1 Tax=Cryptomeria japonica TaxID=3369 RepID=UPI0027DA8F60|nr:lysine histidine transporter 2 [Cryptomeria japonica]